MEGRCWSLLLACDCGGWNGWLDGRMVGWLDSGMDSWMVG